ncbi:MAG: cytochrome c oxidase subunit 3 [Aureliella sp.]
MSHTADAHGHDDHGHGDHDHPPFLAHHFDDPEQQFDSGKLGMWLFLVTEILFFSGMFCAYALYRARNPEVWTYSSQYLNATLGAFNTGVLLFSSLSMAWGVRCAQLRQRTGLVISLAITLGCASMFLGVKAIEYTHKWDIGLLPAGAYETQSLPLAHHEGLSPWLYTLSYIPAACVVAFAIWYVLTLVSGNKGRSEIAGPLLVTALCYFVGVGIGLQFQEAEESAHAEAHSTEHVGDHDADGHAADDHDGEGHTEDDHGEAHGDADQASDAVPAGTMVSTGEMSEFDVVPGAPRDTMVDQRGGAGLFFSIYYCMTGVHAIHILAGMGVMVWLLVRATKDHFNEEYFGPVDYVGLYWHLVDLIWIYLFPLLYLIK